VAARREDRAEDGILSLITDLLGDSSSRRIRRQSTLAELGLDSLSYAEVAAAAEERLGLVLPPDGISESGTVADLVARSSPLVDDPGATPDGEAEAPASLERGLPALPQGLGRLQRPGRAIGGGVLRRWFRLKVHGAEHMPASGAVILCMNHESLLDIPLALMASPRPIQFMAKRELFRNRLGGRALHEFGAFPVDRSGFDLKAIKIALAVIARGEVLGMYPEGTRTPGVLLPFLNGAAWIALRTGAPLLPAAIAGTEKALPPGKKIPKRVPVVITFDPLIEVASVQDPRERRKEMEALTGRLRGVFERLLA
jgi:1-acyl-sn-glycerol-3-phosphate acyltransferase